MRHKQIAALLCSSMLICGTACGTPQQASNNSVEVQESTVETIESTESTETKETEETKESVAKSTETKESTAESEETKESLAESTETVESSTQVETAESETKTTVESSTQVETAESETKTEEQKVAEEKKQEEQQQQPTQSQLGEGWGPDGIAIDPNCPPLPGENYWDYVDRLNQYYIDQGQIIVVDPAVPDGMPEDWFNF